MASRRHPDHRRNLDASLLVDVWRTTSRHLDLAACIETLTPILAQALPIVRVLVRRIDIARPGLETIAEGDSRSKARHQHARDNLSDEEMRHLLEWCARGELRALHARTDRELIRIVAPEVKHREMLLAPLPESKGENGVVLFVAHEGKRFTAEHLSIARELLEPLGVAVENHRRRQEIETRKEAVEADNISLLTRLGREALSETIVGEESGLKPVMERVALVAPADMPVLILGETGSGKEVVARAIHVRSRRSSGPFLRVNCGAIPSELIDSELFGHERGSFTGATATRQGWFERADGGTLFLDEIGELPLAAQVRLLRVLQDSTFERVGGGKALTVDVRIVAATHRDLSAMSREGRFREDLWYRIAVFPLHLPSLRERPEDVLGLATHFSLRAAKRFGLAPIAPAPDDVRLLVAYDWPGNVRELCSVIERAVILGKGRTLEVATALGVDPTSTATRKRVLERATSSERVGEDELPAVDLRSRRPDESLDRAVVDHITSVLATTHGRIEGPFGAARVLGINPHTLRARMRRLGIEWSQFRPGPREA